MKKLLALLAGLLLSLSAAWGISPDTATGLGGHKLSTDRLGTGTPTPACPTGYDCTALGTSVTQCTVGDVAGVITFTVRNDEDEVGVCPAMKAYVSETDWHCEFSLTSVSGGGQYAGAGCEISQSDGDYSTPDPKAYCWYSDGHVRKKYDVGRAGEVRTVSTDVLVPGAFKIGSEYKASTNEWKCGYIVAGVFYQVGTTETTLAFNSGVRGRFSTAYSLVSTATIVTGAWEDTTTLDPYVDAGEPGPDPPGPSDTADYETVYPTYALTGVTLAGGRTTCNATNASTLTTCLAASTCGVTIQLSAGTFTGTFTETTDCPATTAIVIQGAANLGSTVTNDASGGTGPFTVNGDRVILKGIRFTRQALQVNIGGTNVHVLANDFYDWRDRAVSFEAGGAGAEIAYNEFHDPRAWQSGETGTPLRMGIRSNSELDFHDAAWVHDNHFHDFPAKPDPNIYSSGQSDAMEVGHSPQRQECVDLTEQWYIERNLIERHLGTSGIVDLKCGRNVARYNTVLASPGGRIDIRSGNRMTLESNWQEGSGGSNVHGRGNRIIGNYMRGGAGIELIAGNSANCDTAVAGSSDHTPACATTIAGNNVNGYTVGKDFGPQTVAVTTTTLEECDTTTIVTGGGAGTSTVTLSLQNTTTNNCGSATAINFTLATKLTTGQVGPSAFAGASAGYRAPREP